jgi:hypothetical protein
MIWIDVSAVVFVLGAGVLPVCLVILGGKEAAVKIFDDRIQITGLYGTSVNFSDITDVSLLDQTMYEIGAGKRKSGSDVGKILKGHFESESLGKMLLFVQADTAPTIRLKRGNDKDIYISFKDGEATRKLYQDLIGMGL